MGDTARRAFIAAVVFEGGLGALALVLGFLLDLNPLTTLELHGLGLLQGIAATLPMLLVFGLLLGVGAPSLVRIRRILDEVIGSFFVRCSMLQLAVVAAVAGLGEEVLFRGLIQGYLQTVIDTGPALLSASVLFGLVHPLTRAYVVLAGLFGLYLGWLWLATENLLVPVLAHGLYDFIALGALVRQYRRRPGQPSHSTQVPDRPDWNGRTD